MKTTGLLGLLSSLFMWVSLSMSPAHAQVRVGPASGPIDGSASLEVKSGPYQSGNSYRGLLVPTLNSAQRDQIQNPAVGLLLFNTTTKQIEVNTGTTTTPVWTPGGAIVSSGISGAAWSLTGNSGTSSNANFLGTTDNVALNFKVNNQNAGRIDPVRTNSALGYYALSAGTTGQGNSALGTYTLYNNTTSDYNSAVGFKALFSNTTGTGNVASGAFAMQTSTGGQYNAAFGYSALGGNTTGSNNVAVGTAALAGNTTTDFSTAVGAGALQKNQAEASTAFGHNALALNTTGFENVAIGPDAMIHNVDGFYNAALGSSAMVSNTSGARNTASGDFALRYNTTGLGNTGSGMYALENNITGNYNTALGYNAGPTSANSALTNATALGANAVVSASNTIVLGDNNITALRCNVQTLSSLSDKRIKEDIQADVPGLRFITKLTPVTYHVNKRKEAKLVGYSLTTSKEDTVLHSGFLAQDVAAAAAAVGYNFEGVQQQEGGKYYTLGYTLFVIPLVQSVKDLNAEIDALKARLQANTAAYDQLSAQVKQLQALAGLSKGVLNAKLSNQ